MTQMHVGYFPHISKKIVLLLMVLNSQLCFAQKLISIEFQESFWGDTVSFYIEDKLCRCQCPH
jgi:hypothetical protein